MRKILNPYRELEGYQCFGCSPDNRMGLRMEFFEEGDQLISIWNPEDHFQGYHNILHGGVQATLMDEIASWIIQVKLRTGGVTSSMSSRFLKPVRTDNGSIRLEAEILRQTKRLVTVKVVLKNSQQEICADGDVTYFVYPEEIAKRRLSYPGAEKFFEDQSG